MQRAARFARRFKCFSECNTPHSLARAYPQCSTLFWSVASSAVRSSAKIPSLKHVLLPSSSNVKSMCFICHECVAVLKDYNVCRQHIEKHPTFSGGISGESCGCFPTCFVDFRKEEKTIYWLWNCERLHAGHRGWSDKWQENENILLLKMYPCQDTSNIRRVEIQASDVFVFVMLLDEVKTFCFYALWDMPG